MQMSVEFHALSHVVPVRNCNFLRHCKQLCEGTWALVDISIDGLLPNGPLTTCRKRPSGCIVQALPNGYSKVTKKVYLQFIDRVNQAFLTLMET